MSEEQTETESQKDLDIKHSKQLRKDFDEVLQRLKSKCDSPERTLAMRSIQVGIMWLGMDLKRLQEGEPGTNPYPNSYNPENAIVEPTADGLKL